MEVLALLGPEPDHPEQLSDHCSEAPHAMKTRITHRIFLKHHLREGKRIVLATDSLGVSDATSKHAAEFSLSSHRGRRGLRRARGKDMGNT